MGDKLTRSAESDLARAKLLKESLESGTPALHVPVDPAASNRPPNNSLPAIRSISISWWIALRKRFA